uniref:DUF874 family protein n=1 Tax=Helicobacter pylori TaxID=210 RepID=UPI001FB8F7A5
QVDFYKPSSIAYLELDPRDFNATEECNYLVSSKLLNFLMSNFLKTISVFYHKFLKICFFL